VAVFDINITISGNILSSKKEGIMRSLLKSLSCISLCLFLILPFSCKNQGKAWQGIIEDIDGIMVVKNPAEPRYKEDVCVLEEDLSIGDALVNGEPKIISMRDLRVDDEENIFILDSKPLCIKVFNKAGKLIRKFGREGQGPGEWQNPFSFDIKPNGNIIVNDWGNQRLTVFSSQGELINEISTAQLPTIARVHVDSIGNVYAVAIPNTRELNKHIVYKLDEDYRLKIHSVTGEEKRIPSAGENGINMDFPSFYETVSRDGLLFCNYQSKYEFHIFSHEGNEVRRILKEYAPIRTDPIERQRLVKERFRGMGAPSGVKINFPEYLNPILFKFIVNDEGMLVVGTPDRDESGRNYHDIFDLKGRYIAKIPFKYRPLVWKKGHVYFVEIGDEGYQYIKRYKVNWKI
jgi:hypothetical protein